MKIKIYKAVHFGLLTFLQYNQSDILRNKIFEKVGSKTQKYRIRNIAIKGRLKMDFLV